MGKMDIKQPLYNYIHTAYIYAYIYVHIVEMGEKQKLINGFLARNKVQAMGYYEAILNN